LIVLTGAGHASRRSSLPSHRREQADATNPRPEAAFKPAASAQERLPRRRGVGVVGIAGRAVHQVEGQNYANGPASVRQDVGSSRISHLTHDPRGMRFQLSNADDLSSRSRARGSA
jgi:hypothetical protein